MSNARSTVSCRRSQVQMRCTWGMILGIAAVLRFYRLDSAALWYDEAFSFVMSTHAYSRLWSLAACDVHPPLYYFALKGWIGMFGNTVFAMRALSACAGVIAVGLGMWLALLIAGRRAAVLSGIFLAMLPIAVVYSREVRMYALLSIWMAGAQIALVYWVKNPRQSAFLAVYAALITAGLYTHYFAILAVMAHWLYLLTLRQSAVHGGRRLIFQPSWWAANLASAILFAFWLPTLLEQLSHSSTLSWIAPITLRSLPYVFAQYLSPGNNAAPMAGIWWGLVPAIMALSWYCMVRDKTPQRFCRLLVIYLWAPLLIVFVMSLKVPLVVPRYFLFSALSLPVLLGIALDELVRVYRWLAAAIFIAFTAVQAVGISVGREDGGDKRQIPLLSDVISGHYRAGDQIIVLDELWYPTIVYYNSVAARPFLYSPDVGNTPRREVYDRFRALYYADKAPVYIDRLAGLPAGTSRVWLVDGLTDPDTLRAMPCHWQLRETFKTDANRLRLYDTDVGKTVPNGAGCQTH
ncbi:MULTISPECIES: glycosyltransferase family 39 protein [unclassified Pseudomonas]|uniref:glycosyltransferase family 39 protein n=1 Tax=unclassified Pseudomonas TaxID=196821 RepID=UPI0025E2F162|nr:MULTISPECIES: glycosyltransferase family 39 protein [unclassified Pseudomonas]